MTRTLPEPSGGGKALQGPVADKMVRSGHTSNKREDLRDDWQEKAARKRAAMRKRKREVDDDEEKRIKAMLANRYPVRPEFARSRPAGEAPWLDAENDAIWE